MKKIANKGYIAIKENENMFFDKDCEIMQIGIVKKYRNQNKGTELIIDIIKKYEEKKYMNIFARTYAGDYTVVCFYGKNGFIPISVVPFVFGDHDEGMIIMRKKLRSKEVHNG